MRTLRSLIALVVTCLTMSAAYAAYPERPVRVVVPFAAGSGLDKIARATAERLSVELGQQFVVENISGAGGTVGVDAVLAAPRDGHTLLFATTGIMVINPYLYKKLRHDPLKDFHVVSPVQVGTNALVVRPDLPVNNLKEFIAYAKARPGQLTYGSSGVGSSSHLAGALLARMAGIEFTHVPYRGSGAAAADFLGGRLDFMVDASSQSVAVVAAGKARVLGVTSKRRFAALQGWPAIDEVGLPGFDLTIWTALMAPAGVPPAALQVLRRATARVVADPAFGQRIAPDEPFRMSASEFEDFLGRENTKWGQLVKSSGAGESQ